MPRDKEIIERNQLFEVTLRIIKETFPEASVELQCLPRINGIVIWKGFNGIPISNRQDIIWTALKEEIGEKAYTNISFIKTLTPDEHRVLLEEKKWEEENPDWMD